MQWRKPLAQAGTAGNNAGAALHAAVGWRILVHSSAIVAILVGGELNVHLRASRAAAVPAPPRSPGYRPY